MADENDFVNEISEDKKNINLIRCLHCNSLILRSMSSYLTEEEFDLPLTHQKNKVNSTELEKETLRQYWTVDDMFTFENIGVSNTVENTKYLICADCEMGPVGYHNIATKKCFIALKRVKHVPKE